jgi:hypothetical protein
MLNRTDREQRCNTVGARLALALIAYVAFGGSQAASAQQEGPSPSVELGIIVTSTAEEAEKSSRTSRQAQTLVCWQRSSPSIQRRTTVGIWDD